MKKYGSGDGRILKDDKAKTAEQKKEWTAQDQAELAEEQADALEPTEE